MHTQDMNNEKFNRISRLNISIRLNENNFIPSDCLPFTTFLTLCVGADVKILKVMKVTEQYDFKHGN